jgi:hypothetical protein
MLCLSHHRDPVLPSLNLYCSLLFNFCFQSVLVHSAKSTSCFKKSFRSVTKTCTNYPSFNIWWMLMRWLVRNANVS